MAKQDHDSYQGEDETPHDAEWTALGRFVAGECSPEESAAVEERLSRSSDESAFVVAIDRVSKRLAADPAPGVEIEQALARARNRMASDEVRSLDDERARRRFGPRGWKRWLVPALAAGVVFVAGMTLLLREGGRHGARVGEGQEGVARTYATRVGTRDSVTLTDGTRVLLGPGSELTLSAAYGRLD